MLGVRIDMILSGLRPALLIEGFKNRVSWRPGNDIPPHVVKGLRAFRNDGAFASLSDNLAINFFEVFLVAYGAGNRDIGAMAALANLMGFVSLLPGVMAVRFVGKKMPIVLAGGGGIGRLMLLGLALVPFLTPSPRVAIPAIIIFNSIRVFMANFSNPAWTGIVADLVPEKIRGGYFASRNAIIAVIGSAASLSSGWIVTMGNRVAAYPKFGFTFLFFVSFVAGMFSTFWFSRVPEIGVPIDHRRRNPMVLLRGILRYPLFLGFLAFTFFWNFALFVTAPFFNVFLVREFNASAATIGLVATAGSLVQIFALPFWGRQVDRHGDLKVLTLTCLLIPVLPFIWCFVNAPWQSGLINGVGGFLWGGFGLANFNLLLKMLPETERQEGAALYQGLVMASTVLGPVFGAEIVEGFGFRAVFAASGVLRYFAVFVLWVFVVRTLREPEWRNGK